MSVNRARARRKRRRKKKAFLKKHQERIIRQGEKDLEGGPSPSKKKQAWLGGWKRPPKGQKIRLIGGNTPAFYRHRLTRSSA